jgi:glutamine---fructose-6-phosphate transaminase (isomerizing)
VDPQLFLDDLEAKPAHLADLAAHLDSADPWESLPPASHLVLVGMGSSYSAAMVAAARLRTHGVDAVAEYAGSDLLPAVDDESLVIAVSAGGGSRETADAVAHYTGRCPVVLLTNTPDSALAEHADHVVELLAGPEAGGVACRSYQHTVALLLALEAHLTVSDHDVAALLRRSAEATADLLSRRSDWLPDVGRLLLGPQGTHVVAPARRLGSAHQSALMLREGPRVPAYSCETADWSHVDVYLTRTTDYRMLLLAGSRWEDELLRWTTERGSTLVAVGADVDGAALSLRYAHDTDDDVRLLTETLVAELVAADLWADQPRIGP